MRRPAREPTVAYLERVALWYLGRYGGTEARLRRTLEQRVRRAVSELASDEQAGKRAVEEVIRKVRRLGYVDDERAARGWARSMRQRGKSTVAIRAALRQRGVGPEIVSMVLAEGPSDLEGARRFARRRKLGPHRPEGERRSNRQKDLAKLARAGFSYEIAVRVLDDEEALTLED